LWLLRVVLVALVVFAVVLLLRGGFALLCIK